MGGSAYSDDHYRARSASLHAAGKPTFHYDADVKATGRYDVHKSLDPKLVAGATSPFAGKVMRESCDSATHPESRAVAVIFDVTGSMGDIPRRMQQKLPDLMSLLIRRSYIPSPHILFGAIGDATCDKIPLQFGQFEAGGEELHTMFEHLVIEGGGGGQTYESYELGMYFMLRHTSIDCFKKRGDRGYLFLIGDEQYRDTVAKVHVQSLIGDVLEDNISTELIAKQLQEMYDVYHILPCGAQNSGNKSIESAWRKLFGQHVLTLDEPEHVTELIASTIGVAEGIVDADGAMKDLTDMGVTASAAKSVSTALAPIAANPNRGLKKRGTVDADLPVAAGSGVEKL